jgi:hypothetical protein
MGNFRHDLHLNGAALLIITGLKTAEMQTAQRLHSHADIGKIQLGEK